jgi:hypothetical protein
MECAALQQNLVATCHGQASAARERMTRDVIQELEGHLKPWPSPEGLAQTGLGIHYQPTLRIREAGKGLDEWVLTPVAAEPDQASPGRL